MKVTFHNGASKSETVDVDADEVRYTSSLVKFYFSNVLVEIWHQADIIKVEP